ncbi:hypothetical protein [Curtobacterium sp. 18060]|uniref:hypothetical protein n=1 Tax=Curtobacterium sp. 18060 TaxID=2681408 RepID=UPI00135A6C1F|nr:hypothetical protein [Curtobacterium sp. 18060]
MKRRLSIAGSVVVMAVLATGMATPAHAAASYEVSVIPKTTPGGVSWGRPTSPKTTSVKFYSRASAQMKKISTRAIVKQYPQNKLLYDTTRASTNSNINSLTYAVPASLQSGTGFNASMTSKFTKKSGAVATRSTSKKWITPKV